VDKAFYKKVIQIGLPITLSQLLTSLLAFVDTIMVSGMGDNAISAVGIGANYYFLMFMINFGLISGLSIFFAQYYGSKNILNVQKTFIVTSLSAILLTSLFVIMGRVFPNIIVGLYNHIENPVDFDIVNQMGVTYIKTASIGYLFTSLSFVMIMYYRNMEKVVFPQIITFITVVLNTVLNFILINGHLGFPELGVEGAALATVISSIFGFGILLLSFVLSKEEVFNIKLQLIRKIDVSFLKTLFKRALPVMVNEAFWGLGMSMYLIAFSYIDDTAFPSYHIANTIISMFWVINAGMSNACSIMIGNKLGENNIETAKEFGLKFLKLSFFSGLLMGIIVFILSPYIPNLFSDASLTIKTTASGILVVFAFFQPFKFVNAIHIVGTLRSGGDTKFALFAEVGVLWGFGVPMAFVLSRFTNINIFYIVAIVNVEELIKFVFVNKRFFTYKWATNLT
jgi:putative MATE family efflux protein